MTNYKFRKIMFRKFHLPSSTMTCLYSINYEKIADIINIYNCIIYIYNIYNCRHNMYIYMGCNFSHLHFFNKFSISQKLKRAGSHWQPLAQLVMKFCWVKNQKENCHYDHTQKVLFIAIICLAVCREAETCFS